MREIVWVQHTDDGGNPEKFKVGIFGVQAIEEHRPAGEGDRWFYDVNFDNGDLLRIFNPTESFSSE